MALTVSLDDIVAGGNSLLAAKPHWERVRLGDVGQVLNGYAFKAELFTRDGGMPLIRIRDVGSPASETFYSGDFDERYVVSAGDLLVGMDGDFNCARWRGPLSLLNQRVCKITVDEALYLPRFLDYVLPGYLKAINDATSSITVKHLSSRTIQDIPLPLPPLDEQREIVAELEKQFSRLDEAVANLQRVKANLKRYKASVLKAAVEGRLVETEASLAHREDRTYETGEQLLQRILEERRTKWALKKKYVEPATAERSLIESVPEGWAEASVEQISQLVEYGSSSKTSDDLTGIPVLRMGNIFEGELRFDELKYLPSDHEEFPKLLLKDGDLLFNRTNSPELVGKVAVFRSKPTNYSFASYLIRVRTLAGALPEFLAAYINSSFGRQWVKSVVTQQVGQANVNGTKLQALSVPLPPFPEQTRIVAEVDRHLSIIREVEAEVDTNLKRAQALRQSTLAKAFGVEGRQI
ncbi:restriction endonuclease subunit S [Simplicispira suum]|uniref:Restriction endonuclease subunit S n=1 Tax=Simplicispira suum TaxID=2109915 RepID=A0A2S0N2Y8_9BURK|nr:restriction endonuclease subunit S [Simplicispira suum]AVO42495.1 restriction endonuclease subunit S [Simplicispira suum]